MGDPLEYDSGQLESERPTNGKGCRGAVSRAFIHEANIDHFRRKLGAELNPAQRKLISQLLARRSRNLRLRKKGMNLRKITVVRGAPPKTGE
jgi:hypothetical protein